LLIRISIIVSSAPYALIVLAAGFSYSAPIIICAVFVGFGAALLWIAHGDLLTRCSRGKYMGLYSGVFFAIFQLSGIVGNLLVGVLSLIGVPLWLQYVTLFAIACVGVVLPIVLLPVEKTAASEESSAHSVNNNNKKNKSTDEEEEEHNGHDDLREIKDTKPTLGERAKAFAKSLLDTFLILLDVKMLSLGCFFLYMYVTHENTKNTIYYEY